MVALVLAEWKFSATYRKLFEEQFENQIAGLTQAKSKRQEALSSVLEKMAKNPEIISSMKAADYLKTVFILRPSLESLAQERLQSEFGQSPKKNGVTGLRQLNAPPEPKKDEAKNLSRSPVYGGGLTTPFIALIDAKGDFVLNQRSRSGPDDHLGRKSAKMPWLSNRQFAEILTEQQMGYLLMDAGERRTDQVREIFVTPLRDPETKSFLGAFAFGLPLIEKIVSLGLNNKRGAGLPLVLILEPTRELALQVAQELGSVCSAHKMRVLAMFGGSSFSLQGM